MDVFDAIKSRRSVRKYSSRKVDNDVVLGTVEAGLWAPSAGNVQDKEFIVIRDPKVKDDLISCVFEQVWVARAPVIIVLVSNLTKLRFKFLERSEFYATISAGAAIQNMLLFLAGKGLQGTHVGLFDEISVKRALKIPDEKRVFGLITLGYPSEKPPVPQRAELKDVTHLDSYDNKWVKDRPHLTYIK